MREKPETMTIGEYNQLLLNDALNMLVEANKALKKAKEMTTEAAANIAAVYTQERLDL